MSSRLVALLLAAGSVPAADLFRDDFSRFPSGRLTEPVGQLNAAIQEYHYLPHRGVPLEPWENALCHLDAWLAGQEDGGPYLEQTRMNDRLRQAHPLFVTGDAEWGDYTVEVKVKPLLRTEMAGVVFRYHTNRHHYVFVLSGGDTARLLVYLPMETKFRVLESRELGRAAFSYDTRHYYALKVENTGARIRASIDGKLLMEAEDREVLKGKAGVTADIPARFQDFRVTVSDENRRAILSRMRERESQLARLRADNPQPKLWKKFATPGFGTGRNVRLGDLDGDGRLDMLFGQNVQRHPYDMAHISCLTAVTLDGKVLWQSGKPNPRNGLLTYDTPFQIHDIDGDGKSEVVLAKDFKLQVLDGRTGKPLREIPTPAALPGPREVSYENVYGDSIAFVNVLGDARRHEILLKDRYRNFWVYNNKLELLWKGEGQTGHYPYPVDTDGDGRDEIAIGYALWDHDGRQLWSRDKELRDHADGMMIANLSPDAKGGAALLRRRQRRRGPHDRSAGEHSEARAAGARPEPGRRQVPHGCAGAAIRHGQLLVQPGHRDHVRLGRQAAGAGRADSLGKRDASRELARRRPGIHPAVRQPPRGRHDRRAASARGRIPERRAPGPHRLRRRPHRRPARRGNPVERKGSLDLYPGPPVHRQTPLCADSQPGLQ